MRKASGIVLTSLLALPTGLAAQTGGPKVGVISVLRAIVESNEGKQANDDFQKKYEAKRDELSKKQKEVEELQQQLRTKSATLNDEGRAALAKTLDTKSTELQRAQDDAEKEFNDLRNQIFNRIGSKLAPLIQQYARENNFTLILDSSNQSSQLSYADPTIDITDEIIKRFDSAQAPGASPEPATKTPAAPIPKSPAPVIRPPTTPPKK
jgi:outer membrane protein